MKKYHIGKSKIHGKGIILDIDVKKDETIFVFLGREIIFISGRWSRGPNWLQTGYAKWIEPHPAARYYCAHGSAT